MSLSSLGVASTFVVMIFAATPVCTGGVGTGDVRLNKI